MVIRKVHAGHVYLGRTILAALGLRDGDKVEIELRNGEVVLRPVRGSDDSARKLIKLLEESSAEGGREDFFEEYEYEDVGG